MRFAALIAVGAIGVILGLWHAELAMQSVFVFKQDEPLTSWLSIALGPAMTLIASLVAIFLRRVGGIWLIASGIVSFTVFVAGERGLSEYVIPFLFKISLPMIAVGIAYLVASKLMPKRISRV